MVKPAAQGSSALSGAMASMSISSTPPSFRPPPQRDPFGGGMSTLTPTPAAQASLAFGAAPVSVDDLFKDPAWKDPVLPGAAGFGGGVPRGGASMGRPMAAPKSAPDPFGELVSARAPANSNTSTSLI